MNNSQNEYEKNRRGNTRSLYVTLLVILMSVAVVVAVAGSIAKNVKKESARPGVVTTAKTSGTGDKKKGDATARSCELY